MNLLLLANLFLFYGILAENVLPESGECEVWGFSTPPPGLAPCDYRLNGIVENVALHQPTFQSTTYNSYNSSLAVDGNLAQLFDSQSCSHTNGELYPWFVVDLGTRHLVTKVDLYTRSDCCSDRNHDIQVRVGHVHEKEVGHLFSQNPICNEVDNSKVLPGHVFNFNCPYCQVGRFASVQIVKNCRNCEASEYNTLTICELQVYGYPV